MGMAVMHVRIVPVSVHELVMHVCMHMRLASVTGERMRVTVVLIMNVRMRVLLSVMRVRVFVMLGDMQPDTNCHQRSGDEEL